MGPKTSTTESNISAIGSNNAGAATMAPKTATGNLCHLPQELLDDISERLDIASLACLKLVNSQLYQVIRVGKLHKCARWMVTCHLERDRIARGQRSGWRWMCAYCKEKRPFFQFIPPRRFGDGSPLTSSEIATGFRWRRPFKWSQFPIQCLAWPAEHNGADWPPETRSCWRHRAVRLSRRGYTDYAWD